MVLLGHAITRASVATEGLPISLYDMVRDCENRESKLSEWEAMFIADTGDVIESGGSLIKDQKKELESIWNKAMEEG